MNIRYFLIPALMLTAFGVHATDVWQNRVMNLYLEKQLKAESLKTLMIFPAVRHSSWSEEMMDLSVTVKQPTWREKNRTLYLENQ